MKGNETRVLTCIDCELIATPDGPSFHNLNPGEGESMWVCEDCKGARQHLDDALGREPEPPPPPKSYEELQHEAAYYYADLQQAKRRVAELEESIRREYREARAHRTDNRTALTRLYRLAKNEEIPVPEQDST